MSDLLTDMDEHRRTGDFARPVRVEPHTEVGQIAAEYNRVLDAMRRRTDSLQLLRRTSAAANESSSVEEALALALTRCAEFTGWPIGHAFLVTRDDPDELVSTGIWRIRDEQRYARSGRRPRARACVRATASPASRSRRASRCSRRATIWSDARPKRRGCASSRSDPPRAPRRRSSCR